MTSHWIDESKEWFIIPERRGAYTAESPDRQIDLGRPLEPDPAKTGVGSRDEF